MTSQKPSAGCYSSWANMLDGEGQRRFTGLFVCPLTGEKFASGKLVNDGCWTEDHMYYDEERGLLLSNIRFRRDDEEDDCAVWSDTLHRVDLVWYRTKRKAEEAAAARALDCLRRRATSYADGDRLPTDAASRIRTCKMKLPITGTTQVQ